MRYVLLLRGINVGGKNKVSMTELKDIMEKSGFENVSSYINSGNIFFSIDDTYKNCILKIKEILEKNYEFDIYFALLKKEDYLREKEELPDWWYTDLARRDVIFFSYNIDKSEVLKFIDNSKFYNEKVHIGKNTIFWGKYDEKEYLKTTYHKELIKQEFYKKITIRNGNTFEKIAQILENK